MTFSFYVSDRLRLTVINTMRLHNTLCFWIAFLPFVLPGQGISIGEIEERVVCEQDTTQTYAAYIPTEYNNSETWPIVYVFEPAARGSLPVTKYKDVAEELGFIIVCSNNSRNGSWDVGFDAADAMFLDTQNRLSIDSDRVFTSGFSGGSRLALSIAVITKKIRGVIGVGAAQPPRDHYKMSKNSEFLYAGLVGHKDMNYQEHKLFAKTLDGWDKKNILIVSEFAHQWASASDFKIAIEWMFVNTGKKDYQDGLSASLKLKLDAFSDSVSQVDVAMTRNYLTSDINRGAQFEKVNEKLEKEEQKLFKKEISLRLQFGDSLTKAIRGGDRYTYKMLINSIQSIKNQRAKSKKISKYLMYDRVLDYIRASSYETGFRLIGQKQYEKALICVDIWSELTDNLKIKYWWYAKVSAMQGKKQEAIDHLGLLANEGFKNLDLLANEVAFNAIRDQPSFIEILGKVRENAQIGVESN